VANAAKHGKAKNIAIAMMPAKDRFALTVRDDGTGFVLGQSSGGMGVRIMRYRARVIGATLNLQSAPGSGTHVTCLFVALPGDRLNETASLATNGAYAQ
jgi:signal transduction histidine kinase